jgi:hypothetical protein
LQRPRPGNPFAATPNATTPQPKDESRDETPLEKLDRNTVELLNELRVAGAGVQVMFAFLLIAPFNGGFARLSSFERTTYYVTLLFVAAGATLLIAPSVQYRVLFRQDEKRYLVRLGNRSAIAGMACLAVGLTGILVLITDLLYGGIATVIVGVLTATAIGGLWFAVPMRRRLGQS